MRRFFIILTALGAASLLSAQASRAETTAEQAFIDSSSEIYIDGLIIGELASGDHNSQDDALTYAEAAIEAGKINPGIVKVIRDLAGGAVFAESRLNGRVLNNYLDIRVRACGLLAKIPTQESKDVLKKIAYAENEPLIATAAIRALGEIGLNDEKNDVIETIMWVEKKFSVLNPISSLVLEVLNAYDKLQAKITTEQRVVMIGSISEIAKNNNYVTPVRKKAVQMLTTLSGIKVN
jgi:hypothetical protein